MWTDRQSPLGTTDSLAPTTSWRRRVSHEVKRLDTRAAPDLPWTLTPTQLNPATTLCHDAVRHPDDDPPTLSGSVAALGLVNMETGGVQKVY